MGTTGLTAQADGADDTAELRAVLGRALIIAGVAGAALIVLQAAIGAVAFGLLGASPEVETHARTYFAIRIWSAPAALANYAILGWFIGLGRTSAAFALQIVLNGVNIALDALFVLGLGMGVEGVALGTVIAEITAALAGFAYVAHELRSRGGAWDLALIRNADRMKRMIAVNRDILIRTLCLLFAFSWFTAQGATSGDVVLAANAVLMNFLMLSAYFLDGYAFAAETLAGRAIGQRDAGRFKRAVLLSTGWAFATSAAVSIGFALAGPMLIDYLTVNDEVRATARVYLLWAAAAPVVGVACFQLDGIFIGATRTVDMRNMMIVSLAVYLAVWWALTPLIGNHGLWASIHAFFVIRAITLASRYPALVRDAFASEN
jgi:MATE family multidrug resistance protein